MTLSRYERPGSIAEACALLGGRDGSDTIRVLAGGTDLIGDMRAGRHADCLVDIKRIPELHEIRREPDGTLVIGSCVTMREVAEDERIRARYPALAKAAGEVGSYQVRCRATIAGNLSNASPCADSAPVLLVLNARLRVASPRGMSESPFEGFICDCKKTVLRPDEFLTAVVVPPAPDSLRSAFYKIRRIRGHDMAVLNAAGAFDPASREVRLAIGSAAPIPLRIPGLDGACPPGTTVEDLARRLATQALTHIRPINDIRASAEYRGDMTALLCRKIAVALLA